MLYSSLQKQMKFNIAIWKVNQSQCAKCSKERKHLQQTLTGIHASEVSKAEEDKVVVSYHYDTENDSNKVNNRRTDLLSHSELFPFKSIYTPAMFQ